jgi:hypothetical protein
MNILRNTCGEILVAKSNIKSQIATINLLVDLVMTHGLID